MTETIVLSLIRFQSVIAYFAGGNLSGFAVLYTFAVIFCLAS